MTNPDFRRNSDATPPTPGRRRRPRLLLGIAAALTVATGAGLAAANAPGDQAPARHVQAGVQAGVQARPEAGPGVQPGQLRLDPGRIGMSELALLQLGQAQPGQPGRPGQNDYQTFTSQTGSVESVQSGSIAVGGRTYTVDETTRIAADYKGLQGIQQGDQVWVIGTPGENPKAVVIVDASRPPLPGQGGAGAPEQGPGQTPEGTAPVTPSVPASPTD